jgi:hypothetical protein
MRGPKVRAEQRRLFAAAFKTLCGLTSKDFYSKRKGRPLRRPEIAGEGFEPPTFGL